jgi:hypothetical protein
MRILIVPLITLLSTSAVVAQPRPASAQVRLPAVDILYPQAGTIFDRTCSSFMAKSEVTPEIIKAAAELRPRLQAEWSRHGTRYVSAALEEIGAPFPYSEMQATLTVCSVSTMSTPLIINVRKYLPGAVRPAPQEDFSEALFHELMHHYAGSLTADSALKKKFASESLVVLNHLHVVALEKAVLSKLGETDELKLVEQEYRTSPSPGYKRAWEIVSEIGPDAFIEELKDAAKKR